MMVLSPTSDFLKYFSDIEGNTGGGQPAGGGQYLAGMATEPVRFLGLLLTGVALVLVVEGLIYALFPQAMKRLFALMLEMPASALRTSGLVAAIAGLGLLWLLQSF